MAPYYVSGKILLQVFAIFLLYSSCSIFFMYFYEYTNPTKLESGIRTHEQKEIPHPIVHKSVSSHHLEKYSDKNVTLKKIKPHVPKEFQLKNPFWRPSNPDNPDLPLDLDEFEEDRRITQINWMKNISLSDIFKELKPKRIMVEDKLHQFYHGENIKCAGVEAWESKCNFELENGTKGAVEFPNNINEFDAHFGFRLWYPEFERKLPENSKVKQFLMTYEPPHLTGKIDLSLNNAFLVNYWRGADIPLPYVGKYVLSGNWNKSLDNNGRNYAEGKSKLAAITVSNCRAINNRLEYVKELQRYISVDVYGKCGTLNCTEPCFRNLGKEYKFYLSFENSNCRDYITEKFGMNAFENDMVPVVLGAEKRDYLYVSPPNSFIHVEDFESPKELAKYLKELDGNDTMYNEYFHWKNQKYYRPGVADSMCRACALLFIADYIEPPKWPQNTTWESANVCLPQGRWYWHRNNNDSNASA